MTIFPHSRLFLGTTKAVVISGPHAQIIDSKTGEILHSTAKFNESEKNVILKSGTIRCAAVDQSWLHLVTSGDDKMLKLWQLDGLRLLSSRELPKKPTDIQFTKDGQALVVSDKFGDVFSYPLHPPPLTPSDPEKPRRDALTSHENPSGGTLILGHASLMTSFTFSADERYVISADRDEHVRVSWYPQGWNVEMYCLGHEKYVSSVHIPAFAAQTLISGGGDPSFKVWDWMTGKIKAEVEVWSTVQKFVKARGYKKTRGNWGGGNNNDADEEGGPKTRKERRTRNRQGKGKQNAEADRVDVEEPDVEEPDAEAASSGVEETKHITSELGLAEAGELVQVIHKIDSFESGAGQHILFSAVGASALFITALPSEAIASSVHTFDFGRPVLDFTIAGDGVIWVLLDGEWGESPEAVKLVRLLKWTLEKGEFKEMEEDVENALLIALNTTCLLPATAEELKALELYSLLSAMPKNLSDDAEGETKAQAADTKRQQGRLKNKRALMKVVEGSQVSDAEGADEETEGQRAIKRTKSEAAEAMDES